MSKFRINGKHTAMMFWVAYLKGHSVVRSMEYLVSHVGQDLLWQRKETNLRVVQEEQLYITPQK